MVGNDGVATYGRLRDLGARGRFMTEGPSVRRRTIIRSGEEGDARLVRFGYTRVHALLQREGFEVNRKRVYGIYGAASLTVERRTPQAPSVAPMPTGRGDAPDERWSMDFVHDYLGDGRKLRTFELLLGQPASRSNESPCRRAPAA